VYELVLLRHESMYLLSFRVSISLIGIELGSAGSLRMVVLDLRTGPLPFPSVAAFMTRLSLTFIMRFFGSVLSSDFVSYP
jgi:hypothetical protein